MGNTQRCSLINVSLIIGQDRRIPLKVPLDKGDLGGSITEIADFNPLPLLSRGDMCLSYVLCLQNDGWPTPLIKGDLGGSITEIADFNPTPLIKGDMCLSYVLCLQNNG